MARSIKFDNDTYLDASGVEIYATNAVYRTTVGNFLRGITDTGRFSLLASSSATITLPIANTRALVFFTGANSNICGIIEVHTNSSGNAAAVKVVDPSQITFSVSGSTITFSNANASSAATALVICINGQVTTP